MLLWGWFGSVFKGVGKPDWVGESSGGGGFGEALGGVVMAYEICSGDELFLREISAGDEAHFFGAEEQTFADSELPTWAGKGAGFAFGDVSVDKLVSACTGAVGQDFATAAGVILKGRPRDPGLVTGIFGDLTVGVDRSDSMPLVVDGVPALVEVAVRQEEKAVRPDGLAMTEVDWGSGKGAETAVESVSVQLGLEVSVVTLVEGDIGAPVADVGDRLDGSKIHGEVFTTTEPASVEVIDQAADAVDIPFVDVDPDTDRQFDVLDPGPHVGDDFLVGFATGEEGAAFVVGFLGAIESDLAGLDAETDETNGHVTIEGVAVRDDEPAVVDPFFFAEREDADGEGFDDLDAEQRFAAVPSDVEVTDGFELLLEVFHEDILDQRGHFLAGFVGTLEAVIAAEVARHRRGDGEGHAGGIEAGPVVFGFLFGEFVGGLGDDIAAVDEVPELTAPEFGGCIFETAVELGFFGGPGGQGLGDAIVGEHSAVAHSK